MMIIIVMIIDIDHHDQRLWTTLIINIKNLMIMIIVIMKIIVTLK